MTKRQRTFLFFTAAILFFTTTPAVVLYSQGWRLDWDHKTLTHTGGLYVRVNPPRASIFLDDSFVKRTDLFFDSALLTNLLPGEYSLRVEKEGYIPWKKALSVQSSQVTEAKEVILFPEDIEFQTLFSNVLKASLSPNSILFAFQKKLDEKTWELTAWDIENKKEEVLFDAPFGTQWESLQWSKDSKKILLTIRKGDKLQYLIWNVQENEAEPCVKTPCTLDFLGTDISQPMFSPANSQEILFSKVVAGSPTLQKTDYVARQGITTIEEDTVTPEMLPSGIESPDRKKLAFVNDSRLMVFFFETKRQVLLGTFTQVPKSLSWLLNEHVFFSSGDSINVAELDTRGASNIVQLGTFKNAELSWNPEQKSLFVLSEGKFLVSEKLLP